MYRGRLECQTARTWLVLQGWLSGGTCTSRTFNWCQGNKEKQESYNRGGTCGPRWVYIRGVNPAWLL